MQRFLELATLSLFVILLAGRADGQTVTVTTTQDVVDISPSTATVADLPGPDGVVSLSEAMIATNNTPGHQTVGFAIPTSDPGFGFLFPGRAVFTAVTGFYWRANDVVTIDGTTQTAFAGDTNPDGAEVLLYGNSFYLNADGSTLTGFDGTALGATGSGVLFEGNTGTTNITLFGGSGSTVRGNVGGTIKIDRSDGNLVVGNTVQRVRINGFGTSQPASGNVVGGPALADRNFLTGYGYRNSEGLPAGAAIELTWTQGTLIENNWIGTTPDGLSQGNTACTMGINLSADNRDLVVRDNRIAGILGQGTGPHHAGQVFGWAIYFWGSTSNIQIVGNTIGLDANDEPVLGSVWGVNVDNFSGYTVDGVSLVDNVIAGHLLNGIRVGPTATMRISGTELYANGALGIDLIGTDFASGVTANDPLDQDVGGNDLQNHPVLDAAVDLRGRLRVRGRLHSSPLEPFVLEFFASPDCDPSGSGEGELFLGATTVTTDATGNAVFDSILWATVPRGWVVAGTATNDLTGATSELSPCVGVRGRPRAASAPGLR
jgi:hypothetical protein